MEGGRGLLFRGNLEQWPSRDSSRGLPSGLNAAEEEASAIRAQLAESNAAVAGKMNSMNASILVFTVFILIVFL